jgi:hypothetical protein
LTGGKGQGLCYDFSMKKRGSPPKIVRSSGRGEVIGRERFAKISAVEGIVLTSGMKQRAAEFDRQGLSPKQRISAIVAAHRKG